MYRLRVRHVVDIYIYIYIYIDIVTDVPDTSGESKNNIGPPSGGPKSSHPSSQNVDLSISSNNGRHFIIVQLSKTL